VAVGTGTRYASPGLRLLAIRFAMILLAAFAP
jgi:hypothetical protein